MNKNYTYIVASLPFISRDFKPGTESIGEIIEWIEGQLDESDRKTFKFVTDGFNPDCLDKSFYEKALKSKSAFIKSFFKADLIVRNAKVDYLNSRLGSDAGKGKIDLGVEADPETAASIKKIFEQNDLLEREKAIDDFLFRSAEESTLFEYFSLDKILCLAAELKIVERWLVLDEDSGREKFAALVNQVRGSYGNIVFENK